MFGQKNSFSCHVNFIVNQIWRFARTMKKKPRPNGKPYRDVPQAPTEQVHENESDTWAVYHFYPKIPEI